MSGLPDRCVGPLIWYDAAESGAVLECAAHGCDFVVTTGNVMDSRHVGVDLLREGLTS